MTTFLKFALSVALAVGLAGAALANDTPVGASDMFAKKRDLVFQVRVVDEASGDKSSIGSGFQVSPSGDIATNFHVVSSFVHEPGKSRLEVLDHSGQTLAATLVAIDVIHDLAVVRASVATEGYLTLQSRTLTKGERIFSMGNPQDLGMTIIEGNFNGPVKLTRLEKLLFSGSLNPGMSGGPAIDRFGKVVGINVSKGGEQLSFLVPAQALGRLLAKARLVTTPPSPDVFIAQIGAALVDDQSDYLAALANAEWEVDTFGDLVLPERIAPWIKCWGRTVQNEKVRFDSVRQYCQSQDSIYIKSGLSVGGVGYDYIWLTSDDLNRWQFYHAVEGRFTHRSQYNAFHERDVTKYDCHTEFLVLDDSNWKASTCVRAYKKYPELIDLSLLLASLSHRNKAAVIKFSVSGASGDNAFALVRRMLRTVQWRD
ncbi:MAG: serine protease [Gammaproteobacteria bacterium]|nr:serine protease [Gammaproteobacteria bacterium]